MKLQNGKKWYRPREIAALGLIRNSTGGDKESSNYNFILVQIKNGSLKARNYAAGSTRPYFLVSEQAIADYNKNT